MPNGLLNPKNAAPDTGGSGFKEGMIRVDTSVFRVHKDKDPDPLPKDYIPRDPICALIWDVTRLNENMEPMTDEHENPLIETLKFGLGGKSITKVHPGKAEGPDDEEVEDLGVVVGTEGPTVFMADKDFQIHPKSAIHYLYNSLKNKVDEKFIDRVWAPDWNGLVVFMKSHVTDDKIKDSKGVERPISYKVVDKVVAMGKKAKGEAASKGEVKGGADPKSKEAETKLVPILEALSSELDTTSITMKAFNTRVATALKKNEVDAKLHVPILALIKDEQWLKKNSDKFDMTVDFEERTVVFGTLAKDE